MEKFVNKNYKVVRSENYNELLKEIGLNSFKRFFALKSMTTTTQLTLNEDGSYTLLLKSKLKKQRCDFNPKQEFEEKSLDGRKVKSSIEFRDNVMIHTQSLSERPLTIERRFFDDEMIAITSVGDVISTSWSKCVE